MVTGLMLVRSLGARAFLKYSGKSEVQVGVTGWWGRSEDITKDLTINGPGADLLTLDANNGGRVLTISGGVTLNLNGARITRGRAFAPDSGAGILILDNSTVNATGIVVDSSSAPGGAGGGII